MKKVARITAGLQDPSVLNFTRQMEAFFARSHQLEEASRRITAGLQDSSVLRSIHQIDERYSHLFTGLQDNARQMDERYSRLFARLQDSSVLRSIHQIDERYIRLFTRLQDNTRQMDERYSRLFAGLQDNAQKIEAFVDSARLMAIALQESPAMKAIREFSNTPFNPVVKEIVFNDLDALEIEQSDISEYPDFDVDQSIQEIQKELAGSRDYNRLSERAKSVLLSIYHRYLLPILLFYLAP